MRVRAVILVSLLAAALAAGCGQPEAPPNLLLITIDTLRPDRLGQGGNERPASPALDRLAAESATFERSYSQSGWTLPSIASILTGLHPAAHGAFEVGQRLDREVPTLAELLAARGYDNRALISHVLLRSGYGLSRGFASYDDSVLDVGHPHRVATAEPLTELALAALDSASSPFFVWVHYFDPHFAYLEHREWSAFGNSALDRYDGEIAHTDRQIGRLLDALERRGEAGRTVVAVTSDHGEAFGARGRFHYGVNEDVLRTPLLIRAPGLEPGGRGDVAQQIDLLPTLLALLGVAPPEGLPGRDLLAPGGEERPVYVERLRPRPFHQRVLIDGHYKLTVVEQQPPGIGPRALRRRQRATRVRPGIFLHDLAADPDESRNLWDEADPLSRQLLARLEAYAEAAPSQDAAEIDDELREKLRGLGYLD